MRDFGSAWAGRRGRSPPTPPAGSHTAGLFVFVHSVSMAQLRSFRRGLALGLRRTGVRRSVDEGSLETKPKSLRRRTFVGGRRAQRSMPDVLDFPVHGGGRPHRDVGIPAFKCLHPSLCECERAGRVPPPITPPSISGRPNTLRITRRVFPDAPTPSKLLRRVFPDAPTPSKLLRRVFPDAPTPSKLLRRVFPDAPTPSKLLRRVFPDAPTPSELLAEYFWELDHPNYSVARRLFPSQCSTGRIAAKAERRVTGPAARLPVREREYRSRRATPRRTLAAMPMRWRVMRA